MAEISYTPDLFIAAGAVLPPLCAVAVGLRFYTRLHYGMKLGMDDWLVVPALLLVFGMGAGILAGVALHAVGYPTPPPTSDGSSPQQRVVREMFWAFDLMQVPALASVKLSFLFFYRRIFYTGSVRTFNVLSTGLIVIVTCWAISFFFAYVFVCKGHFSAFYESTQAVEALYCVHTTPLNNGFAISDVITDLMIILLPIPQIWHLHMTTARKVAVTAIFSLGGLTIAASVTRMVIYIQSNQVLYTAHIDIDIITAGGLYWIIIATSLGLCASCLPVLYRLFNSKGLQSIVASVREIISLRSLSPHNTSRTRNAQKQGSQESNINMVSQASGPRESYTYTNPAAPPNGREILVTHTMSTAEERKEPIFGSDVPRGDSMV